MMGYIGSNGLLFKSLSLFLTSCGSNVPSLSLGIETSISQYLDFLIESASTRKFFYLYRYDSLDYLILDVFHSLNGDPFQLLKNVWIDSRRRDLNSSKIPANETSFPSLICFRCYNIHYKLIFLDLHSLFYTTLIIPLNLL
jgi:hypothetical protein